MTDWFERGCDECRRTVLSGSQAELEQVAVSDAAHADLRRCRACGALWIENEREAHVVGEAEARATFPDAFES